MADEKDKKEKTEAKDSKESKATEAKADKKPAAKAPAKKDSKEKPAKKPAKKAAAKKEPKADADDKPAKADADDEKPAKTKKPRRRSRGKKADAKEAKPARRRRRGSSDELPVVRASAKYVRVAPRKARLIADQVRGMHIEQARALLEFSPRAAAQDIHKLIDSAAANAENNHDLIGDEMRITSITVDEGPTLRRFRPRALGRATPINKRTSHIAVALTPVEDD
jgi:ribosomal protein L22